MPLLDVSQNLERLLRLDTATLHERLTGLVAMLGRDAALQAARLRPAQALFTPTQTLWNRVLAAEAVLGCSKVGGLVGVLKV